MLDDLKTGDRVDYITENNVYRGTIKFLDEKKFVIFYPDEPEENGVFNIQVLRTNGLNLQKIEDGITSPNFHWKNK